MVARRLKHAVGRCKCCDSDAVYSQGGKYADGKKYWSVVCSNKDCGVRTSGHVTKEAALMDWTNSWQKETKEVKKDG